jgi:hypothetical protein
MSKESDALAHSVVTAGKSREDQELADIDFVRRQDIHGFMKNEPLRRRERELLERKGKA